MASFGQLLQRSLAFASLAWCFSQPFDVRESSIDSVHNGLFTGMTTCRDVVSAFIARIEEYNPTINAIITLNPKALDIADSMDARIASGNATGSLFCIPILLKDNYDAIGMPTTGGCLDLAHVEPTIDSPVVAAFKSAGALILGKTNLHELALEGLTVSSLGGQTINPYDHSRTPGGSSGGTGAAVASSFSVFGTGTDTVNSLRSPASANNLFSFRPTRGLLSRSGVIPISYTQDAVGCIARSPKDLSVALTVMSTVGYDPADNTTALIPSSILGKDYMKAVEGGTLKGKRLGLISNFFNYTASHETTAVTQSMSQMVSLLKAAGVEVVNITDSFFNSSAISTAMDVQTLEYRQELSTYLARSYVGGSPRPANFKDLYSSGKFLVIPSQYSYVETAWDSSTNNGSYFIKQHLIQNLTTAVHGTFRQHNLDALIYPEQMNLVVKIGSPSQIGRNGILAAVTGSPVMVVPAGWSPPSDTAPIGVPIGMEIMGMPWSESDLLNMAQHISEIAPFRRMPVFANQSVEIRPLSSVPKIMPNAGNISPNYPIGKL